MDDALIQALTRAVDAAPQDRTLRAHLAGVLLDGGRNAEAIAHCAALLQSDPADAEAAALMARALNPSAPPPGPEQVPPVAPPPAAERAPHQPEQPSDGQAGTEQPAGAEPGGPRGFDWHAAEQQLEDIAEPMFVDEDAGPDPTVNAWDVERTDLRLADVGGMKDVKDRLEASFLAPLRNPKLRAMYNKSLRGGMLLYGPPGCGKTFLARAVAGEMGAKFISVGLSDILDMWIGASEKNIAELFRLARQEAPVVLFLDEIDALGQKRSATRNSSMRGAVNQLLQELDGIDTANEGVFVLGATNQLWDVDPALRRPGRFDRTLLVAPPDGPAREAILRHHLKSKPVAGVDLRRLAKATDGFSGADLAYVCELAAEAALLDSVRLPEPRLITMADLEGGIAQVSPSCEPWFQTARNVVMFGDDASYKDLRTYMKKTRRL